MFNGHQILNSICSMNKKAKAETIMESSLMSSDKNVDAKAVLPILLLFRILSAHLTTPRCQLYMIITIGKRML